MLNDIIYMIRQMNLRDDNGNYHWRISIAPSNDNTTYAIVCDTTIYEQGDSRTVIETTSITAIVDFLKEYLKY